MKNSELKDFVLRYLAIDLKKEFYTTINPLDFSTVIRQDYQNLINSEQIELCLKNLSNNQFIIINSKTENGDILIEKGSRFFDFLDVDNYWHTSKFHKGQMELDLLATKLDTLSLELKKLESSPNSLQAYLPKIDSATSAINSASEILKKLTS